VEPLTSPEVKLHNFQYLAATWQKGVLQVTMNTGERYQFLEVRDGVLWRLSRIRTT
jgi:hypothetical protein